MTKPWEITADDIENWAQGYGAAALLPKLVRRLLLATEPVDALEMRADGGTRLGGADGVVRAREEGRYCPAGVSVWEMSTEVNVRRKLDGDFEKRTLAAGEPHPLITTYVGLTARRFNKKDAWVRDKKVLPRWADVRLLDADDLATWLEGAPAVALWFAEQLGKPTGASELETFLQRWSDRTAPPLPHSLVLAGSEREKQAAQLRSLAERSGPWRLFVQAETQDEATLFTAAALSIRGLLAERAVVVENADTFAWLTRPGRAEPLLAIAAFESPEIGRAAAAPVRLIVPVDASASPPSEQTFRLERQPFPALVRGLVERGWQEHKAERLVTQAGGSLTALQHLCGYFVPPEWARDVPQPELIAFLLMGAWTPTNEADREVVSRLGGDPSKLEHWCAASVRGPWVEQAHNRGRAPFFRWRALTSAWKALEPALSGARSWRRAFLTVAGDILGELNLAFELPREQRFYAGAQGKVLRFSGALRDGVATALIQLALSSGIPDAASSVAVVVRGVLDKERGWRVWASLDRLLPKLAEAAPTAFLNALDDSLDSGDAGVAHFFADEGPGGVFGHVLHTGLLWALELLAWLEDFGTVQGTVLALARLAEIDRDGDQPGKVANRPLASLKGVLDAAAPQSSTSVEQRLSLLRLLSQRHPDVAWKILNSSFGLLWMPRMTLQGHAPIHRLGGPNGDINQATESDFRHQLRATIALWLEHAGTDAERWASALEPARHLPDPERIRVLDTLAERAEHIHDTSARVWSALRERVSLFFRSDRSSDHERSRLQALYKQFEPSDIVIRLAWLFGRGDALPEPVDESGAAGWRRRQARLQELRHDALSEIRASGDEWQILSRLAESVELPGLLGDAMAMPPYGPALEGGLLHGPEVGPLARVVPSFLSVRAFHEGYAAGQMQWLSSTLQRLVSLGRLDEAARGAANLMPQKSLWDFLDEVGDPLKTAYWKALQHVFGEHSVTELERALRELVRVGRAHLALEAAGMAEKHISGEAARFVLESLRDQWQRSAEEAHDGSMVGYHVQRLFEVLDRDPPDELGVVARLEIPFLSLLQDHDDVPKRPLLFGRLLGAQPELFVQLLLWMYKPRDSAREEPITIENQRMAENAYRVLRAWKGYPGEGLDEAAREEALERWCRDVFELAAEKGRGEISVVEIANVLARAPVPADAYWPCLAARRLLEARGLPDLDRHLRISEFNRRNGRLHPVSSERERAIAEDYKTSAGALRDDFPRTARMLDEIAESYQRTAEEEEREEQEERIRYGDPGMVSATSPVPPARAVEPALATVGPLRRVETHHVGPAPSMALDLAPRLNLLTGDNSLGKTFVLDVLFWALTGVWPPGHAMARPESPKAPRNGKSNGAATTARIVAHAGDRSLIATYDFKKANWASHGPGPLRSSLVVYARVDGGFSVWDPLRNADFSDGLSGSPPCFHFGRQIGPAVSAATQDTGETLWEGLREPNRKPLCNGLIADAVQWRDRNREAFARLREALKKLSPPEEPIQFDAPKRLPGDTRDHPRLALPYGSIYAVHASAAVKRALSLAYALVWAVVEMKASAELMGVEPPEQAVLLIDEIEAHLHPKWQRTILCAVIEAANDLLPKHAGVQIVATTHSALVIASAESLFDPEKDALFHFDASGKGSTVTVEKVPFHPHGEADVWLTSPLFGLSSTRSVEAEEVLRRAGEAMKAGGMDAADARAIDKDLRRVLSELDPFWMRWRYIAEKRGWLP